MNRLVFKYPKYEFFYENLSDTLPTVILVHGWLSYIVIFLIILYREDLLCKEVFSILDNIDKQILAKILYLGES